MDLCSTSWFIQGDLLKKMLKAKNKAKFISPFIVNIGSHSTWQIEVYPCGDKSSNTGSFKVNLVLLSKLNEVKSIRVCRTIECKELGSSVVNIVEYSKKKTSNGWPSGSLSLKDIKSSKLKTLTIKIEVNILSVKYSGNPDVIFNPHQHRRMISYDFKDKKGAAADSNDHDSNDNDSKEEQIRYAMIKPNNKQSIEWVIEKELLLLFLSAYNGKRFSSEIYENKWSLMACPNGNKSETQGQFQLFLQLCGLPKYADKLKVKYMINIKELDIKTSSTAYYNYDQPSFPWATQNVLPFDKFKEYKGDQLTIIGEISAVQEKHEQSNDEKSSTNSNENPAGLQLLFTKDDIRHIIQLYNNDPKNLTLSLNDVSSALPFSKNINKNIAKYILNGLSDKSAAIFDDDIQQLKDENLAIITVEKGRNESLEELANIKENGINRIRNEYNLLLNQYKQEYDLEIRRVQDEYVVGVVQFIDEYLVSVQMKEVELNKSKNDEMAQVEYIQVLIDAKIEYKDNLNKAQIEFNDESQNINNKIINKLMKIIQTQTENSENTFSEFKIEIKNVIKSKLIKIIEIEKERNDKFKEIKEKKENKDNAAKNEYDETLNKLEKQFQSEIEDDKKQYEQEIINKLANKWIETDYELNDEKINGFIGLGMNQAGNFYDGGNLSDGSNNQIETELDKQIETEFDNQIKTELDNQIETANEHDERLDKLDNLIETEDKKPQEYEFQEAFSAFDKDHDGKISMDELGSLTEGPPVDPLNSQIKVVADKQKANNLNLDKLLDETKQLQDNQILKKINVSNKQKQNLMLLNNLLAETKNLEDKLNGFKNKENVEKDQITNSFRKENNLLAESDTIIGGAEKTEIEHVEDEPSNKTNESHETNHDQVNKINEDQ